MCPICVIGTGILMEFFRWLGVDDIIVGLWLGGFTLSSVLMINKYLSKKLKLSLPLILVGFYASTIVLLWLGGLFSVRNEIFGVNKTIFGMAAGSLLLLSSLPLDKFLRKINGGRIFISHQKVFTAIGLLLFFSLIFYLTIR